MDCWLSFPKEAMKGGYNLPVPIFLLTKLQTFGVI